MGAAAEPTFQFTIFNKVSRSGAVESALADLKHAPPEARGAIHTRAEVASFVLDLAGYIASKPLHTLRLLEPSFGTGVFLFEAADRLLDAWQSAVCPGDAVVSLGPAIRAVEIHEPTFDRTRVQLRQRLLQRGVGLAEADAILDLWLTCDDFLLTPLSGAFDVVVGNPPYVRQESIAPALIQRYRLDYTSIYDRADLYVPFIERGLTLLALGGHLTYICADRWMKNNYGGPLRKIVADRFDLRHVVKLHGADAFEGEVDAYPSVFTIARPLAGEPARCSTAVTEDPKLDRASLTGLAHALCYTESNGSIRRIQEVARGDAPWVFEESGALAVLRSLEARFPSITEAGCKVGIGVATGADRVFIAPEADLPIEPDRILPLAMARDVRTDGTIEWSGKTLANPFGLDGKLVDLSQYPKLQAFFAANEERLRQRHVAKKTPARWYRTIDKVHAALTSEPKLLIPDIKGQATVAYDSGEFYPHHNLYHVTSSTWDLRALQAVLRSRIAEFQVAAYAVRMRGGYLRFQAQYLRRIRLPRWEDVSTEQRQRLADAATSSREACDEVVRDLYGLDSTEWADIVGTLNEK